MPSTVPREHMQQELINNKQMQQNNTSNEVMIKKLFYKIVVLNINAKKQYLLLDRSN